LDKKKDAEQENGRGKKGKRKKVDRRFNSKLDQRKPSAGKGHHLMVLPLEKNPGGVQRGFILEQW